MKRLICSIFLLPLFIFSQEDQKFDVHYDDEPLYEVLLNIEAVYNVRFSFPDKVLLNKRVTLKKKLWDLKSLLETIASQVKIDFEVVNARYIIIKHTDITSAEVQQLEGVIVNSYLVKGISKKKNAAYHINPEVLDILPGITDSDVLENIQQLPGVVSPNETASGFLVRGGASDQNRLIWDGINIYHKGHLFGMISPINNRASKDITFYNKGTNPRFGERISSVIDINSGDTITEQSNFKLGLDGINVSAAAEVPLISDKLSVHGTFRRSYQELFTTFTLSQITDKVFQSTKISNTDDAMTDFDFMDYTVKINYQPNKKNQLSLSLINITNNLDYQVDGNSEGEAFNDLLRIDNLGYGFSYKRQWSSKLNQRIDAFFSDYTLNYNFITSQNGALVSDFEKKNAIYDSGISTEFQANLSQDRQLSLGYQYVLKDVSYAFLNTTPSLSFILDTDRTIIRTHVVYANYDTRIFNWADLSLGFRAHHFSRLNDLKIEPRVQLYKKLSERFSAQVTGEVKHQVINEIDETVLSDLSLENRVWRLADGDTFPIISSYQVSAGFLYAYNGWHIDVDNYYKNIDGKTALSLGFLNPDNPNFQIGSQKIYGSDVFIKKTFWPFKVWTSYSFNSVQNTFNGINNGERFTASNNIKHVVSTSLVFQKQKLQLAAGWRWHSGKPFTEAIANAEGEFSFIGVNTKTLPAFHRLDISAAYDFSWGKAPSKLNSKIGLSVRNVYNRRNLLSREYVGNNNLGEGVEIIDKYSLGITPNVFFVTSF